MRLTNRAASLIPEGMKKCTSKYGCGEIKDICLFLVKDKSGRRGSICDTCRARYGRISKSPDRDILLADLLKSTSSETIDEYGVVWKKCAGVCEQSKTLDNFHLRKETGKLRNICIECEFKQDAEYRAENAEHIKTALHTYYIENKVSVAAQHHDYYIENRDDAIARSKAYASCHKQELSVYKHGWYIEHKDETREKSRERRKTDPCFKLACDLRRRIIRALINGQKAGSAVRDLGCSIEELNARIESLFYSHPITSECMTWFNWSLDGWHLDHIIPLAHFDLTDREQFLVAAHYLNLQPLLADENLSKGDKLPDNYEELLAQIKQALKDSKC